MHTWAQKSKKLWPGSGHDRSFYTPDDVSWTWVLADEVVWCSVFQIKHNIKIDVFHNI